MNKTPSKNIKRAYAIASYMATSLKAYKQESVELQRLELQCLRAMRVFTKQFGYNETMLLSKDLGDLWQYLYDNHSSTIDEDSVPALIEAMGMIIHPKDHKDFLGVPTYNDETNQHNKHYNAIMGSVNAMNWELNKLLGTKSVTLQKPKPKKVKVKRPKVKSKAQKAHEKRIEDEKQRVERVTSFLRDRVAKARGE